MILPSFLESAALAKGESWLLLARTCAYAAAFGLVHFALRPVVRRTAVEPTSHNDWCNRVMASAHAIVSGIAGAYMIFQEAPFAPMISAAMRFKAVDTVHGDSPTFEAFLPFTLGYFVYDCVVMATDRDLLEPLLVVHHALSLLVWPISFLSRAGNVYIAYFLATELSTPLLHLTVFFLPKHGVDGGGRTLVGLALILVFFLFRVLPCPAMLFALATSWQYWSDINPAVTGLAFLTIPIPPFLFNYWFYLLIQGMLKALSTDSKAD